MQCIHQRPLKRCGKCLKRKDWPQGYKMCVCWRLIPKDHLDCGSCANFRFQHVLEMERDRSLAQFFGPRGKVVV